jgi:succinate dehydrogenase/fumarate reductase cytochrome b subunit
MLKQIQAGTGLLFAVFLTLHLVNTWLASLGPAAYDAAQGILRQFYQFAPFEAMFLAALMVHLISGVLRIFSEPKRTLSHRARWHRYAGLFLLVFIGGHILAVRGSSIFYDVYPGFAGLAFSIEVAPGYFYPYYFLLALAGLYHGLNGIGIAAARLGAVQLVSGRLLNRATLAGGREPQHGTGPDAREAESGGAGCVRPEGGFRSALRRHRLPCGCVRHQLPATLPAGQGPAGWRGSA